MRKFVLNEPGDLRTLNRLLSCAGISVQPSLLESFFVLVDEDKFNRVTRRNAGRRTICSVGLIMRVMTMRAEGKTIREIAYETDASAGIVSRIIREHFSEENTVPGQITVQDLIYEQRK
jgi:uncharacterized protein YerC